MKAREVRKVYQIIEDTFIEGHRAVPRPMRTIGTAVVFENPWPKDIFTEDLIPEIRAWTPILTDLLIARTIDAAGGPEAIEAYGKSALVGTNCEVELGAAFIHTLHFGNAVRKAVQGTSFMPSSNRRGAPGSLIVIPLKHKIKEEEGSRAHFMTMDWTIPDAPGPNEIVVAIAVATSGRPHHRIGDRYKDMEELGVDQTGSPLLRSY
jgi:hypothetical protein